MTRENSSFKYGTLLVSSCRRQAALFTLSLLAMIAALPIATILEIQSMLRYNWDNSDPDIRLSVVQDIKDILYTGLPSTTALVVMAVVAGIAVFRYLHVRNQTDFFHGLPVTRRQMFSTRAVTGLLAVIPAYLLSFALACAVCVAYGYADVLDAKMIACSLLAHLAGFLLVYALSVLAAVLCGNTLVSLLVCGWLQFGLLAGWEVVCNLLDVLYPARATVLAEYSTIGLWIVGNIPVWLAPPVQAYNMLRMADNDFQWTGGADYVGSCVLPALVYAAVALVVLGLCYALYRVRKSENTGLAIAFPVIRLPLKLYMVSVIGIACGLIFEVTTSSWPVMFLGMALGAVVVAGVTEVVYDLDFHSVFHHWKSMVVYAAVCAVVLACMAADVTHWNTALPAREDVVAADMEMSSTSTGWYCGYDENTGYYDTYYNSSYQSAKETEEDSGKPLESPEAIDALYDSAVIGSRAMAGDRSIIRSGLDGSNMDYTITFTLKDGKTFRRTYYMPADTEALEDNGATVRFTQEYKNTRTAIAKAQKNRDSVTQLLVGNYLDVSQMSAPRIQSTRAIASILDTLEKESMSLTQEYVSQNAPVLILRAVKDTEENSEIGRSTIMDMANWVPGCYDIPVYACETDTLAMLKESLGELQTGFDSAHISSITVTQYDEDGNDTEHIYTDSKEIAAWKTKLLPQEFMTVFDPVYKLSNWSAEVTLTDGSTIYCSVREEDA